MADDAPLEGLDSQEEQQLEGEREQTGVPGNSGTDKSPRERSSIVFPYGDLEDAIQVATATHARGNYVGLDALAAQLNHAGVNSGTFIAKVSTAVIFGLIERDGKLVKLTDLGHRILDPDHSAQAKVDAFLNVPLYRKVYDDFRGRILPQDTGLENVLNNAGVASKQKDKARQAMQRSATTAGFFHHGSRQKLIVPPGTRDDGSHAPAPPASSASQSEPPINGPSRDPAQSVEIPDAFVGIAAKLTQEMARLREAVQDLATDRADGGPVGELHPAIQGMLATLPHGDDPSDPPKWSYKRLNTWATTFTSVLKVVYENADPDSDTE